MKTESIKELTFKEILAVLAAAPYARLSVAEKNQPYTIPMYYQWHLCKKGILFTLKSLPFGEKMRCIYNNRRICLEFEQRTGTVLKTVVAKGIVIEEEEAEEHLVAFDAICPVISGREFLYNV